MDTSWRTVGAMIHCRSGTCYTSYTMKVEKSTQLEYGSETSLLQSNTKTISDSISNTISNTVNTGFSDMGIQFGISKEHSRQRGSERSFGVTNEYGFTVSYSTSTANTVGVEQTITCNGIENENIFIQMRTNMTQLTGNVCILLLTLLSYPVIKKYKCDYVDLKMYPVNNQNIFTEFQCNREKSS